jgi:hypothetical protein
MHLPTEIAPNWGKTCPSSPQSPVMNGFEFHVYWLYTP